MPVNRPSKRSSCNSHANQLYPSSTRAPTSRSKLDSSTITDVIVLSSDEDDLLGKRNIGSSGRFKRKSSKNPFSAEKVLEIFSSSSDEGSTVAKGSQNGSEGSDTQHELSRLKCANELLEHQLADHRLQCNNLKKYLMEKNEEVVTKNQELATQHQELIAYREEIKSGRQEIESQRQQLAALQPKDASKLLVDIVKLEDSLSCDICAHLMYSPYILIDCGHCYCEECLKGWFDETLTKHMRTDPWCDLSRNPMPRNVPQVLQALHPNISFQLRMQLLEIYNNSLRHQPDYTCPGCRRGVTVKPVVNYALKEVASVVANALGRSDMRVQSSILGPFDGFFP